MRDEVWGVQSRWCGEVLGDCEQGRWRFEVQGGHELSKGPWVGFLWQVRAGCGAAAGG